MSNTKNLRSISSSSSKINLASSPKSDSTIDDVLKAINSLRSSQDKLIKSQNALGKDLISRFETLTSRFDEIVSEMTDLQTKLETLHTRVLALESISTGTSSTVTIFDVIHEFSERDRCKANIIIHGLPESSSSDHSTNLADDKTTLTTILRDLPLNEPVEFKLIRLGKHTSSAPRPSKVIFESNTIASRVLSAFRSEKSRSPGFLPQISMVRDKTRLEREKLRECHRELEDRRKNGEPDLNIVYRDGVPCVLKTRSKNIYAVRHHPQV